MYSFFNGYENGLDTPNKKTLFPLISEVKSDQTSPIRLKCVSEPYQKLPKP